VLEWHLAVKCHGLIIEAALESEATQY